MDAENQAFVDQFLAEAGLSGLTVNSIEEGKPGRKEDGEIHVVVNVSSMAELLTCRDKQGRLPNGRRISVTYRVAR